MYARYTSSLRRWRLLTRNVIFTHYVIYKWSTITPVMKIRGQPSELHWYVSKNHPLPPLSPVPLDPLAIPAVAVSCLLYVLHAHSKHFPHFFSVSSTESWNEI
ncbi:hypothetical protein E2C01_084447 [Portunus trituberculatus]|uniref:Uncharacterized protein n=1 Tax=Portunus trituberculatus TaxID=210409 RepID=A0A5B7J6B3_PORTR|nr:hypothetical protein [Portunus trituberculatus]